MSRTPGLVNVVTPCYNAEAFVGETIDSVRAQTYAPIEHIVVDDASTDGSWGVVEAYGDAVTAVRMERNGGGSRARNAGAALARGEFLVFLDADDVLGPDAVEALVAAAREHPASLVYCAWRRLRYIAGEWRRVEAEVPLPEPDADPLWGWLNTIWVPPCAVLWPRAVYDRMGGWDEDLSFNDDADLMMRTLAEGVPFVRARGGESYYRALGEYSASVSHGRFTEKRCRSNVRVHEKLAERLAELGRLEQFAPRIGYILRTEGSRAIVEGYPELGRECLELADRFGEPEKLAPTRTGDMLARLLGVEGKERIAGALARVGIMTPERRRIVENRRRWAEAERGSGR
jgi:O-antigen biosynthesis protein